MPEQIKRIVLWLFVMNLGVALGAGLYEKRIVLPQWFTRSPGTGFRVNGEAMRRTDTGRRFWAYVTTGPLTLLTLASLVLAWRTDAPRGGWWLGAAVIVLAERIMTFTYFIPTALKLMRGEHLAAPTAAAMASRWVILNHLRAALYLLGRVAALKALSWPCVRVG